MRKSFKVIVLGIVVIVTAMLMCKSGNKAYEKKLTFNSIDEIIEVLNNNPLEAKDKSGVNVTSNIFSECLSKRKRICGHNLEYSKIKLKYNEEKNTKKAKNQIINEYLNMCKESLKGYKEPKKIDARIYDFQGNYTYYEEKNEGEITLVFIDEGEGWVIDYFMISKYYEEETEEKEGEVRDNL